MKTLSKAISFFILALLLTSTPALACTTQPPDPESLTVNLDPVEISLFNYNDYYPLSESEYEYADVFKLCAIDLSYPNNSYDLLFNVAGSDDWQNFNTMFGPFMYTEFDPSDDIINLNLRLYDSDLLVSEKAEVTFFSFEPEQIGEYNWYDWVVLNWLDEDGSELNVSTFLSTFPCGDPLDRVGTTAVPIPGTGLLLSLGILCLIGRRNSQR